jgi:DNA-binding response OmpR family regulator
MAIPSAASPRKVLIVDDDDATRHGLCALVTEAGFAAIPAATLTEASNALTRESPDLIITDVRLKGYNGMQLLTMGSRPIPAIVVTGFPDRMLEADAHKMGADYLEKPLSPTSLLALIRVKLEASAADALVWATRRWVRKPVKRQVKAWIKDLPVRILDVSYGGLRLELEGTPQTRLPRLLSVTLPTSHVAIDVKVVWQKPSGATGWLCGAAVLESGTVTWRQLVDAAWF